MTDFTKPSLSLLCKLGSIAVHTEEFFSLHGHTFDRDAILSLLKDEEVKSWIADMEFAAMVPKKRGKHD